MRILKFVVQINHNAGTFFPVVSAGRYVRGVIYDSELGCMIPDFADQDAVLYSGRAARFLVRELRRVGYHVKRVPWLVYAIRQRKAAKAANPWG